MPLGPLVVIYFLTIPFITEAEKNGVINKGHVNWLDVIKLKIFLKERWRYAFFVLIVLVAVIFLIPPRSDEVRYASFFNILTLMCAQSAVWGLVFYRNFKIRKDIKNGK